MDPAVLEQVDGADEVVLDELPRRRSAIDAGQNARIRGRIDHGVTRRERLEV